DPVSAANIEDILRGYTASGGTVIGVEPLDGPRAAHVRSRRRHRTGRLLASGTVDEVRGTQTLQDRFVDLVGGRHHSEGPQWLRQS
ncbi:ABC transporter, partial [Microbacterium sp. SUBG005]